MSSGEQRPFEAGKARAAVKRGSPAQLTRRAADEHVLRRCVQHPVVALAGVVVVSRHFHKALVQAEVVSDGVLPALPVLPVVRKVGHDVLVDTVEREPLLGAVADGHHDEGVVAVRGLLMFLILLVIAVAVLGFGAVDGFGARYIQFGIAEVRLRRSGVGRRGSRGRRRLVSRVVHKYRIYTEISFKLHHVDHYFQHFNVERRCACAHTANGEQTGGRGGGRCYLYSARKSPPFVLRVHAVANQSASFPVHRDTPLLP